MSSWPAIAAANNAEWCDAVFAEASIASESWQGCLAMADAFFPGAILVGYESGDTLKAARAQGFEPVGPLRVWRRDD